MYNNDTFFEKAYSYPWILFESLLFGVVLGKYTSTLTFGTELTMFQHITIGVLVAAVTIVLLWKLMLVPILGLLIRAGVSIILTYKVCLIIPFREWTNNSIAWLIPIHIIIWLLMLWLNKVYRDVDWLRYERKCKKDKIKEEKEKQIAEEQRKTEEEEKRKQQAILEEQQKAKEEERRRRQAILKEEQRKKQIEFEWKTEYEKFIDTVRTDVYVNNGEEKISWIVSNKQDIYIKLTKRRVSLVRIYPVSLNDKMLYGDEPDFDQYIICIFCFTKNKSENKYERHNIDYYTLKYYDGDSGRNEGFYRIINQIQYSYIEGTCKSFTEEEDALKFLKQLSEQKQKENNTKAENEGQTKIETCKDIFFHGCNTLDAAKKKYHKAINYFHPDNESGDEEITKYINLAYKLIESEFKSE